jgi:PhzF family phenazine biosynthesis protein
MTEILRYAAFTDDPAGGNPAGVVPDASGLDDAAMLAVAADLGYSESAFLVPGERPGDYRIRYFSPLAEVAFCGHATVAAAVALAERGAPERLRFNTASGLVEVDVRHEGARPLATLTSVPPTVREVDQETLAEALAALRWSIDDLDSALPPKVAFAGVNHLVIAAASRGRLARLDYDFDALRDLMLREDWTTVALVWREAPETFHARNPFPVGGVIEDPATGAAAAAFGAYLRDISQAPASGRFTILQGEDLGRPSRLLVTLDQTDSRVRVTGQAVCIPQPAHALDS